MPFAREYRHGVGDGEHRVRIEERRAADHDARDGELARDRQPLQPGDDRFNRMRAIERDGRRTHWATPFPSPEMQTLRAVCLLVGTIGSNVSASRLLFVASRAP